MSSSDVCTLVHLSDPHINEAHGPNFDAARELVAHIDAHEPDDAVVLITGDIVDDGTAEQYEAAHAAFRGLPELRHTIIGPGNHDYREMGTFYSDGAAERFRQFRAEFTKVESGYPYVMDLAAGVRLIMLDSCASYNDFWGMARGEVGYTQRLLLAEYLEIGPPEILNVVALHHHPFDRGYGLELMDADAFLATLAGRCHALLFGHKHEWGQWGGVYGVGNIFASGKVTDRDAEGALTYARFEICADYTRRELVKVRG